MRGTLTNWDRLAVADRRAMQIRRLRAFLANQVMPFSPFYRAAYGRAGVDPDRIRSFDDLRRLPFTTKQDLLSTPEHPQGAKDFVLAPSAELIRTAVPKAALLGYAAEKLVRGKAGLEARLTRDYAPASVFFTTGRSTGSVPFFLSRYDHDLLLVAAQRIVDVLGLKPGVDRTISLFPYAPHLAFWQVAFCGLGPGLLTLNTGGGRVMPSERMLAAIDTMKPSCIAGMPGFFWHLLRRAVDEKRDWSSVRVITLGGENVPDGFRSKVTETMAQLGARNVRVASVLGFTESRACWTECTGANRTGFHTYPDLALFEIINPETGEPVPEGHPGELVFTNLDGRGSIVIRYRTGDLIEGGILESEPCPGCGRLIPRITSNLHRVSNVKSLAIGKIKGTLVNLNTLSELFSGDPEIEEWQLEIRKRNDDAFDVDEIILWCATRGREDRADFEKRIQEQVYARGELHLNAVMFEDVPAMLRRVGMETLTKEERIVDRRAKAMAGDPARPR